MTLAEAANRPPESKFQTRLINVHIPETAGGPFGELLANHFGSQICLLYYQPYDGKWNRLETIPEDAACIHGHFPARQFIDTHPDAKWVTWLRDPAERVAAEFDRLKRNPDPNSELSQMIANGATLLDFAENQFARNAQVRYVDTLPLERFAFVGISEDFRREVKRFSEALGMALSFPMNEFKRVILSDEARKRLRELNGEDEQLYFAALGQKRRASMALEMEHGKDALAGEEKSAKENVDAEKRQAEQIEEGYFNRYVAHLDRLRTQMDPKAAFEAAVGGDFETVGKIELAVLRHFGLTKHSDVVDVGCGSGRLALQLAPYSAVSYVGTDVVPDLLEYARKLVNRPDWRFEVTDGIRIPCEDGTADFITFFSVFTHITHEDCFRYLKEAKRVIRPGGRIVVSFLEFRVLCHWEIFRLSLEHRQPGEPMNLFMDRDALNAWASHLDLEVVEIVDGDKPYYSVEQELQWSSGHRSTSLASMGQSVAVLTKR